jgi:hypothetical protein
VAVVSSFHCNVALVLGPFYSPFGVVEISADLDMPGGASPLLAAHRRGHQHDDQDDCDRDHDYDDAGFHGGHHDSAEHVESFLDSSEHNASLSRLRAKQPVTPALA